MDLSYGREEPVFSGLRAIVGRDQRIALVGPNGAGKSSLLKMLAGIVLPEEGQRKVPAKVRIAYFAQHQTEQLNPELTVLEELMTVSGQATQTALRTLLGAFLFSGDDVFKKVAVLSGGERGRGWFWPSCSSPGPTCCSWTSPPTTWTSPPGRPWRTLCAPGPAPSAW